MSRYKEPTRYIFVPKIFRDMMLRDFRNNLKIGTMKSLCSQHGVKMSVDGEFLKLSAPKDRIQTILEFIHFSGVRYTLGDKPPEVHSKP
jgi:hypothetical protein